ncbi:MAG: nucleotidyltransferase [Deltaproteobacteria bacterium]|nr:nucleotidyltransferase [Deltaproteobacteria bacterium]MBI3390889.1 nucleotidyltransferase [Deltaproteobacteria bacterium]
MARAIAAGFAQLRSNLEITGLQASTVSTRQTNVRAAVERRLTVLTSFLSGSYQRSTMIAPLKSADIDIFVILDPEYFSKFTPAGLLDKVRTILLETYPETPKISRNGQAVTITFTDFTVDVVPGFHRRGGGYLIPDSTSGGWLSTDPTVHDSKLAEANRLHTGDLVPLVKMIKGWNRVINDAFVGFYLELMTQNILTGVKISDFPSGVRFVFDKGREKIRYKVADPAGYGGHVNPLNGVRTVDDAVSRFSTACDRAIRAEEFEANGRTDAAFGEWRKIFGDYYPAYG